MSLCPVPLLSCVDNYFVFCCYYFLCLVAALAFLLFFYVSVVVTSEVFTIFNFFLLWCVYVVSRVCVHVMSFTVLRHDYHRVLIFIMSCVSAHKLTVFLSCVTDVLCSCVDVCVCFFSVSSWQY